MLPHLKALIQSFQNQRRNWAWHHPEDWKRTTFTRTHLEPLMTEIFSILLLLSISRLQGFLLRYLCNSFLPQLAQKWRAIKVGSPKKVSEKGSICSINHQIQRPFFGFPTLMARHSRPVELTKSYVPKKKPYNLPFEKRSKTGKISVMRGSRQLGVVSF